MNRAKETYIRERLGQWYAGELSSAATSELLADLREARGLPPDLAEEFIFLQQLHEEAMEGDIEVPADLEAALRKQTQVLARAERMKPRRVRLAWLSGAAAAVVLAFTMHYAAIHYYGMEVDLSAGNVAQTEGGEAGGRADSSMNQAPTLANTKVMPVDVGSMEGNGTSGMANAEQSEAGKYGVSRASFKEYRASGRVREARTASVPASDIAKLREGLSNISEGVRMATSTCSSEFDYYTEGAESAVTNATSTMNEIVTMTSHSINPENIIAL